MAYSTFYKANRYIISYNKCISCVALRTGLWFCFRLATTRQVIVVFGKKCISYDKETLLNGSLLGKSIHVLFSCVLV